MRKILSSRLFRCLICLILICVLLINISPIKAEAMSGAGVIGGGAAAAGLTLTVGQVAILLLGAFGVYYVAKNADALGESLKSAISSASASADEIAAWWESAKTGAIDLVTAPGGIASAVKDWASGFISGSSCITAPMTDSSGNSILAYGSLLPAGTVFLNNYSSFTFSEDVYLAPYYTMSLGSDGYYSCTLGFFVCCATPGLFFSMYKDGGYVSGAVRKTTINGSSYYYSSGSNWFLSETPLTAYDIAGRVNVTDVSYSTSYFFEPILAGESLDYESNITDVYPDVITGGIKDKIDQGIDMDVIGLPDIVIPGADVLPVNPDEDQTQADAITDYLIQSLINGDITWEDYWKLIGVYNPDVGTSSPTIDKVNEGTGEVTKEEIGTGEVVVPAVIGDFTMDLTKFFPFCIPFDLYDFFTCLNAEPEAPVIEWIIPMPGGDSYPLEIDLSPFDSVAEVLRKLQLLLFCVGLAFKTRDLIKG